MIDSHEIIKFLTTDQQIWLEGIKQDNFLLMKRQIETLLEMERKIDRQQDRKVERKIDRKEDRKIDRKKER